MLAATQAHTAAPSRRPASACRAAQRARGPRLSELSRDRLGTERGRPRATAAPRRAAAGDATPVSAEDLPPAGCERVRLELKKPLGLVLEANKAGNIFVVEVLPEGSAAKDGRITVGDELIATSAIVYTREDIYGGVAVKGGQQRVRLQVKGERFETVMSALGTHPGHMAVTLDIQKCRPLTPAERGLS